MAPGTISFFTPISMAEEENEVLDWGNEDDVVSLGDEDEQYTLEDPTSVSQNVSSATPSIMAPPATPPRSPSPPRKRGSTPSPLDGATPALAQPPPSKTKASHSKVIIPPPRLTHALPPKPMTTNIPYVPPSDPSIVEATLMASRPKKTETTSQNVKAGDRHDLDGPLPTPWEVGLSRSGDLYYVNSVTGKSTWTRPSSNPVPVSTDSPTPLTHDDRHYRPNDDRYPASAGRHREQSVETSEPRHDRHYSGAARSRDRSRSFSPPARENRTRIGHRTGKGRANNKSNGSQKEHPALDLPNDDDRHWVPSPSPSSTTQARNSRRQNRPANASANDRVVDTEVVMQPPQRELSKRGHHRDKNHSHTSPHYQSSDISAPRPVSPPPRDDHIIYEAKGQVQRREASVERRRGPGPATDPEPPARKEKPSRFGPGPVPATPGGASGLPTKPMTTPDDRSRGSRRERQNTDRIDQHRRFDDHAQVYATSARSPENTSNNIDRPWIPANEGDRERTSPFEPESSSLPPRKRLPLPPQEAEFRGLGKSKPGNYPEPPGQLRREDMYPPTIPFRARDKVSDIPPTRPYPTRDDAREGQYNHPTPSRSNMTTDYDREYVREQGRERGRSRQHFKDQIDVDGNFDMMGGHPPMQDHRGNYSDHQHEPPLKPRAMQIPPASPAGIYPPPPHSAPVVGDRYRGRPSPPHLAIPDNRREADIQLQPSTGWQPERREEWRPPLDRVPAREPRGRQAPASSANSIPIGSRKSVIMNEVSVSNEYPASVSNERIERLDRATYPSPNEPPTRQARTQDAEFSRSYHEPEPNVMGTRQNFNRATRNDSYMTSPSDNTFSRGGREEAERIRGPLSASHSENSMRQRGGHRYSAPSRKSRYDPDSLPPDPLPQDMRSASRDTSPRGRYPEERPLDVSPDVSLPPSSRQASFTSSQSQWEPTPLPFHEHGPRGAGYHNPSPHRDLPVHFSRMEVEPLRQGSGAKESYPAPVGERYPRNEEFEVRGRIGPLPPSSRGANQRDGPFFPDRRVPVVETTRDDIERGGRANYPSTVPFDEGQPQSARRVLNDRIAGLPHPPPTLEGRGNRKQQFQEIRQDNGYNGEPDAFEPPVSERVNMRPDNFVPPPSKTFEQRLETGDRGLMQKGSLLSRISRGGNEPAPSPPPLPQSLRDRVQVPLKRGRDDMVKDHFPDGSFETDEGGDNDPMAAKRRKRRGPRRRGGLS